MQRLDGKSAFITGGASGIGLGTAEAMADAGASIVLADIEEPALRQAGASLSEKGHVVDIIVCDVTDEASVQAASEQAIRLRNGIDIVVNSAGVAQRALFGDVSLPDWRWHIDVNLLGPVLVIKAFQDHLANRDGAHIVNIGALSSIMPIPMAAAYNAAKGGLLALTESLEHELAQQGIAISVVLPAGVDTRLHEAHRNRHARYGTSVQSKKDQEKGQRSRAELRQSGGVLEPIMVGRRIVEAMAAGELHVFTHPAWRSKVEDRLSAMSAALDAADKSKINNR